MDKFITKIANYWNNLELSTLLIGLGVLIILWSFCRWILQKVKLTPPGADRTLDEIDNMTGAQFEEFVAAVVTVVAACLVTERPHND